MMRAHSFLVALLLLTACGGTDECPAGSTAVGSRCIANDAGVDAAADLGPRDAEALDSGPFEGDLGVDACVPTTETCNGADDDCDGLVDEGFATLTHYADTDGDSFGDDASAQTTCSVPAGRVLVAGDCDDASASVHPGATEVCNSVDDNCDGATDEGLLSSFYADTDGDGFGALATTVAACTAPAGYVVSSTDCNDALASVHPGATEVCNGVDEDCNGVLDNGFTCAAGASTSCATTCASTGTGTCEPSCSLPPAVSCTPPAEACNSVDDDCDGLIDEGTTLAWGRVSDLGRASADQVSIVGDGVYYAALSRVGTSLVVRQLDTTSTPVGGDIVVAADAEAAAITLNGTEVVIAWLAGGVVYAKHAPLNTLTFAAAATSTIADPPGFVTAIDVAASAGSLLFAYVVGQSLYAVRTNSTFGGATPSTLLVTGNDLAFRHFDVSPAAAGGWAIAYSERLASETDREVFLQAVAPSGTALDGAAFRTNNTGIDDAFPALAFDAPRSLFVLAWYEGVAAGAPVKLNTFRLTGSGVSRGMAAERALPIVVSAGARSSSNANDNPLALDIASGTATVVYMGLGTALSSSTYDDATLARVSVGEMLIASATTTVGIVTPVGTSGARPILLPARVAYGRTGTPASSQSQLLACP